MVDWGGSGLAVDGSNMLARQHCADDALRPAEDAPRFPNLLCSDIEGTNLELPRAMEGRVTLLCSALSSVALEQALRWHVGHAQHFAERPDVETCLLLMYDNHFFRLFPPFVRWMLRRGTLEESVRPSALIHLGNFMVRGGRERPRWCGRRRWLLR